MTAIHVFAVKGQKQIKRYIEYVDIDVRKSERKTVALDRVKSRFARCHPDCTFTTTYWNISR